jgi:hypothetical protein
LLVSGSFVSTHLLFGAFSGTLVTVNIGLTEDDMRVATTNSLDGGHGNWDLALTINVGTHNTQNMLKLFWDNERHLVIS